jgi:hypothetical protein
MKAGNPTTMDTAHKSRLEISTKGYCLLTHKTSSTVNSSLLHFNHRLCRIQSNYLCDVFDKNLPVPIMEMVNIVLINHCTPADKRNKFANFNCKLSATEFGNNIGHWYCYNPLCISISSSNFTNVGNNELTFYLLKCFRKLLYKVVNGKNTILMVEIYNLQVHGLGL